MEGKRGTRVYLPTPEKAAIRSGWLVVSTGNGRVAKWGNKVGSCLVTFVVLESEGLKYEQSTTCGWVESFGQ
jgi:hypothetical protein